MIDRPIDAIDKSVLTTLVDNQVSERRDLEFKRALPGRTDEETKEFLADVTSLANAHGGDLIFGIEDIAGVASGIPGVPEADPDAAILRLENIIRSGVGPRLIGVRTHWVPLASDTGAVVIRVPASWAAPRRVIFKNSGRFFNRNSRGKYEMDVHELRHAFTQSERLPRRFRQLHDMAVNAARGTDMPFRIKEDPTAVVSIIPLAFFSEERDIGIGQDHALLPVKATDFRPINTIEGVLMHTRIDADGAVRSFALTHRSGRTDVAWTVGGVRNGSDRLVWPNSFEEGLLEATKSTQAKLRQFGIDGPWVILATVFGFKGYLIRFDHFDSSQPAWRDQATLAQLVVEQIDEKALLPIFESFWLMFGMHRPEDRQTQ